MSRLFGRSERNRGYMILVTIADDREHARQRSHLVWSPLRVAASNYDANQWVGALNPSDISARIPVCFCRYRTGVHHHHAGLRYTFRRARAQVFQTCCDCVSVRLAGTASEVFHVISCHSASVTIARRAIAIEATESPPCRSTILPDLAYIDCVDRRELSP